MGAPGTKAGMEPRRVCAAADVKEGSYKLVHFEHTPVAIFRQNGKLFAIDNRCPHMGFPLCKGEIHEGIVVCPWHHWKFDLATGGCFSAGEYDVTSYQVKEEHGEVLLGGPQAGGGDRVFQRHEGALREGLKSGDPFQIAKAVAQFLRAGGEERRLVRFAAERALELNGGGPGGVWGGLTSLANAAFLAHYLEGEARILALVQAMVEVSGVIEGAAPRRPVRALEPLESNDVARLKKLLNYFSDKQTAIGAERCMATLAALEVPPAEIAHAAFEAIAQHLYPGAGHPHDFLFRAFDLLDQVGWDLAPTVLGRLGDRLASGGWAEDSDPWTPYVERLFETRKRLADGTLAFGKNGAHAIDANALGRKLAEAQRQEVLDLLDAALAQGASAAELSRALNVGWMLRLARFSLVNETDWEQVFHGVIAADSIDQAIRRFGASPALVACVYDSAVRLYLTQSLNIPRVRLPQKGDKLTLAKDDADAIVQEVAACLEIRQPDRAAALVAHYLWAGHPEKKLISGMLAAMFRENGDFHTFQTIRACVNQYQALAGDPDRHLALVGIVRMFAAQRMQREVLMSTQFALKLSRGEYLAGADA
ncbi:MAG: Rieske (2Fe-2S) protein [Planctomycetota bacterium]|nr:Rieske (2Fe-2S) protein [Planctomycetota bacterium]